MSQPDVRAIYLVLEKILDSQQRHRKNEFLVRQKKYSQGDDIQEPEENLHNAGKKLQEYLQSLPKITSQQDNFSTELEPRGEIMSQTSFGP